MEARQHGFRTGIQPGHQLHYEAALLSRLPGAS